MYWVNAIHVPTRSFLQWLKQPLFFAKLFNGLVQEGARHGMRQGCDDRRNPALCV